MADADSSSPCTIDPYVHLQLTRNQDGSITRHRDIPRVAANRCLQPPAVLSDDVVFNRETGAWVRLFLPRQSSASDADKLPVVVYLHGGGFIYFHADSAIFHDFCSEMAARLGALVVSVDYRLAPEHRLPAAYNDTLDALHWIASKPHDWLRDHADVSNCFLMGTSAGGNIAYSNALGARIALPDRIRVHGLILHHPFLGGVQRTDSELRLANDPILPITATDLMWELSLPVGADRDHEYSNSIEVNSGRVNVHRILVTGCNGDPLVDRQKMLVEFLAKERIPVDGIFHEGGHHAIELINCEARAVFFNMVENFMRHCCSM